jgi:hypothetical protein
MRKAEEWRKAADDHPPPTPKTDPKVSESIDVGVLSDYKC